MGQLLFVQGSEEGAAKPVFERGLSLFRSMLGLDPHDVLLDRGFGVAKLPRLSGPGTKIERPAPRRFRVSVGTYVGALRGDDLRRDLDSIDGLFFVAEGDAESVTCATDRCGRLHVYHAQLDHCVALSTSALVLAALVRAPFDPLGCHEMLGTGSVFEDRSLFEGVRKLGPGTVFEVAGGRIASKERYWEVRSVFGEGAARASSTVPALAEALTAAVDQTLRPVPRPIVDLTGGFDSRGIVGAALASGRSFHCVVNGRDGDPDVTSAATIAKTLSLHLVRLRPDLDYGRRALPAIDRAVSLTDGEHGAVEYASVLEIHERLARQGDATVNGTAGEVCRGYWWDLLAPHTGSTAHFDHHKAARRFVSDDWADGILAASPAPSLVRHFEEVIRRANTGLEHLPNTVRADNIYVILRMQRWAGRLASATDRIWPCATPFMFRRPLEIALTAPIRERAHNRMARQLIEHLNPELAALPMAGGYPAAPIRLTNALRFLPLAREIAGKVLKRVGRRKAVPHQARPSVVADLWAQDDIRALLAPAAMRTAHLYQPAVLAEFLRSSEAPGFTSARNFGRILTLELVAQALARVRA